MKKIPLLIISLLICLFFDTVNSKRIISVKPPYPEGGYSAVQENIEYPAICVCAGIELCLWVEVRIDSKGEADSVSFRKNPTKDIKESVVSAIQSVKWKPAYADGKPIIAKVEFPILFFLTRDSKREYIMRKTDVSNFMVPLLWLLMRHLMSQLMSINHIVVICKYMKELFLFSARRQDILLG